MDNEFCGRIIVPGSPGYNLARQEFNRAIQKYPAFIAYCTDEESVVKAVHAACKSGLPARVRSGGHHYEGFSVGNRAAVIDVSCMNDLKLNEAAGTLTAGPGVLNRELYATAGAHGYPFPSGTCPTVAVAGLTQGGGWGLSARMFGLTCDNLLSATLIDSCGRRHRADADHDKELFFALRGGGGGNFGVVTSLTYKLPPKLFDVTYVEMEALQVSEETAAAFILCFQRWLLQGDRRFTPLARVYHTPEQPRGIILRGIYYGNEAQARASLSPFLSLGLTSVFKEMTFLEAIRIVEDTYPPYEKFANGGRFAMMPFTKQEALRIVSLTNTLAPGSVQNAISFFGLGGAVSEVLPRDTAFFYRGALNIVSLSTDWEDPAAKSANRAWFARRFEVLRQLTSGSYVNFPTLENPDYMRAYYGGNTNELRCVKARIDPDNLFRFPQSIPPA